MSPVYYVIPLTILAACVQNTTGGTSGAALDCSHRDREICLLETSDSGSRMSHASLVKLDADAIEKGMNERRSAARVRLVPGSDRAIPDDR